MLKIKKKWSDRSMEKYRIAKYKLIMPIKMPPILWLALNPIHAFHIVILLVRIGDEDCISLTNFVFLEENLLVKKVKYKWVPAKSAMTIEPTSQRYFAIFVYLKLLLLFPPNNLCVPLCIPLWLIATTREGSFNHRGAQRGIVWVLICVWMSWNYLFWRTQQFI